MTTLKAVSVSEFKSHCLHYLESARTIHTELIVTKRGKPIAKLVPIINQDEAFAFGDMQGTATIIGDIVEAIDIEWDVV